MQIKNPFVETTIRRTLGLTKGPQIFLTYHRFVDIQPPLFLSIILQSCLGRKWGKSGLLDPKIRYPTLDLNQKFGFGKFGFFSKLKFGFF